MNPQSTDSATPRVDLPSMRENYALGELCEQQASADPHALFSAWLAEAVQHGVPEANAMTLATVGSDMRPSLRVVLLKGHDEKGLVWFTNYQSRKGVELAGNPCAALQFFWLPLQRTVRIEGRVTPTTEAESEAYFHSRPLASRLGAVVSPQSRPIEGRAVLEQAYARLQASLPPGAGPERPPHWGGYRLLPERWEFWQGRASRLHDRLLYTRADAQSPWLRERLAP